MVILILTVALKPGTMLFLDPRPYACTLIKGTAESQGNKQVVFKPHAIEENGEMNCTVCTEDSDYSKFLPMIWE